MTQRFKDIYLYLIGTISHDLGGSHVVNPIKQFTLVYYDVRVEI